ncbi:DUF7133 domain-containing protein [Roseibacillus ishigakijimensis]|uniref:C-type cytochrome n=1 Tax=Roseibacillus ishigakijimensis TaxID=454146 RepID=A0A934RPE1_9BACT|nr:c-type cytochrome [Roseibacillus ishigakijimensis]MBK1834535.1 c-type cytochrome [Roseibacillus ishigakijimensis]
MKVASALSLLLALSLLAQQGNRDDHENMDPVVPEELIPPAPVLTLEQALKTFRVADGYVIEPVAAEPLVEKPVALTFDANGNIWVVEMRGYMPDLDGNDEDKPQGRIAVLQDTDDDGQVDKRTIFWDGIHLPRAVTLVKDGALVADNTSLYFVPREGIERTGEPRLIDDQYAPSGNVEHRPNGMMRHLNNWFYNAKSDKRYLWKDGQLTRDDTAFRGQWGITMDSFGRLYHNNNSTILFGDRLLPDTLDSFAAAKFKPNSAARLGSNRVFPIRVTPGVNRGYISRANGYDNDTLDPKTHKLINTTGAAGLAFYRGDNFPESHRDLAFTTESTVNLVKATRVTADGLTLKGEHLFKDQEFLASTDERFRPVNAHTAPDGTLYIVDFYHGIIQHKTYLTSYLRAQYESRGLQAPAYELGRIYRIRHAATPRGPQPKLATASRDELLKALAHPNGWWRDTAQRLLIERAEEGTAEALRNGLAKHDNELARLHILWTLQGLEALTAADLQPLLTKEDDAALQCHALAAALTLPVAERAQLAEAAAPLAHEESVATPYALRLLSSLPASYFPEVASALKKTARSPFATDVVTTGLLKQNVTTFPETKTKVDGYLTAFAKNAQSIPPEQRLKGSHLESFQRGKALYLGAAACVGCHGTDGQGLPNLGPPLDESEWVEGSPERLAKILLHGLQGPITVNGKKYTPLAAMPGLAMNPTISHENIADIMTYLRAEWSNTAPLVLPATVEKVAQETASRNGRVYTAKELED